MASRLITIKEGTYDALSNMKMGGESFTDVIERLISEKALPSHYAGAWTGLSEEEGGSIERGRKELRRMWLKGRA